MTIDKSSNVIYLDILEKINEAKSLGQNTIMYIIDTTVYDASLITEVHMLLTVDNYSITNLLSQGVNIVDVTWN